MHKIQSDVYQALFKPHLLGVIVWHVLIMSCKARVDTLKWLKGNLNHLESVERLLESGTV